jgi:hypothetical protein
MPLGLFISGALPPAWKEIAAAEANEDADTEPWRSGNLDRQLMSFAPGH